MKFVNYNNIKVTHSLPIKIVSTVLGGLRIPLSYVKSEKPFIGTEKQIIEAIHQERFKQSNNYVITGGHFSQLFVRNLGIFYNALLDYRIPSSTEDWNNRQAIALKTVSLDLAVFSAMENSYTTIVPITSNYFTGVNIYAPPSDSLFGILYTVRALTDPNYLINLFPTKRKTKFHNSLNTIPQGQVLTEKYQVSLQNLLKKYIDFSLDTSTNLLRKNIRVSSARDGIKRESSFYDNVILWATVKLASELGVYEITDGKLLQWKNTIIDAFWNNSTNIFLDDLSKESKEYQIFSADCLIFLSTGFLNLENKRERDITIKVIEYIQKNDLDKPFPLRYSSHHEPRKLYPFVRYFAPNYMSNSIWSHWGIEYCKLLTILSQYESSFSEISRIHLDSYRVNIEKYGGYPELYSLDGKLLKNRVYKSVLRNGWVINYEQARLLDSLNH